MSYLSNSYSPLAIHPRGSPLINEFVASYQQTLRQATWRPFRIGSSRLKPYRSTDGWLFIFWDQLSSDQCQLTESIDEANVSFAPNNYPYPLWSLPFDVAQCCTWVESVTDLSSKSESFLLSMPHADPIRSHSLCHMLICHHSRCLLVAQLLIETRETSEDTQAREGT